MKIVKGGVTQPQGFQASGLSCGIKKSGKPDLSLIVSTVPCASAAVFTKNTVKAAPLIVSKKHLSDGKAQAILTNSGNANCFTGESGLKAALKTAAVLAKDLGCRTTDIIVSSTGIIGKPLPVNKIIHGIPELVRQLNSSFNAGHAAATAIMTTDTFVKEAAVRVNVGGKNITIGGCAKGSGMIAPDMATMLAYITTDAAIERKLLQEALAYAVQNSFNCINVDGCMSTNDMAVIMANSLAGNKFIQSRGEHFDKFCQALKSVCFDLAKKIVQDGEGAKKLIHVYVNGAPSILAARKAAMAIANSNLVKTAAYGKNANWGRIAAAVGSTGLNVTEKTLRITTKLLASKEVIIKTSLGMGKAGAMVLTCDLTEEYVKINGAYN
ncbi:MAG: bifunctional glutamate N-acetyltransferase/amino-acid acetyltransferase ArgJ [Candidatus Omnitrophota bacterium]